MKDGQVTRQFDGVKVKKDLAQTMKEMTQVEVGISKKAPEAPRQSNGQAPRHFDGVKIQLNGAGAEQEMKNEHAKFLSTSPNMQIHD